MFGIPNATPKNLLVQWIVFKNLREVCGKYLGGSLVDIGCGEKPYRSLLAGCVSEHVGIDHEKTIHDRSRIDMAGTAYSIPVEDGRFDSALCSAVLEHLEDPEAALRECYRVLKPGGACIYTVPFIWHLHEEPRDFFRFTKYGLKYLFEKSGFRIEEIRALSGFWATFGQLSVYNLHRFNRGVLRWTRIIDAAGLSIQALAWVLDRLDKTEQWTWMYLIVASKPNRSKNPDQ